MVRCALGDIIVVVKAHFADVYFAPIKRSTVGYSGNVTPTISITIARDSVSLMSIASRYIALSAISSPPSAPS